MVQRSEPYRVLMPWVNTQLTLTAGWLSCEALWSLFISGSRVTCHDTYHSYFSAHLRSGAWSWVLEKILWSRKRKTLHWIDPPGTFEISVITGGDWLYRSERSGNWIYSSSPMPIFLRNHGSTAIPIFFGSFRQSLAEAIPADYGDHFPSVVQLNCISH